MSFFKPEQIIKPLEKGAKVVSIAISSPVNDQTNLLKGLKVFTEWGLVCENQVVPGRNWGHLAGDDAERYQSLHPKKAPGLIAFAKGGWGAARLLERRQPWKKGWFLGYSDLSSILLARVSAGFDGAIHGPLVNSLSQEPEWSKERLKSILFKKKVPDLYGEPLSKGVAKGPLIATNLTVASHLLGSEHMPDLRGAILVLEDIGEEPYRIERMLTQWRINGLLQNLAGLAFGNFLNCEPNEEETKSQSFTLKEILIERSKDLNCPVIADLPVGHCCGNAALPLGWEATIDGNKGRLSLNPF